MYEALVLAMLLIAVLAAAYFYVKRRQKSGAFLGRDATSDRDDTATR